jgi:hypothetical protein
MFKNIFKKTTPKSFTPPKYAIFNVDVFNTWFNDPNNGATYANSGIFLRVDKLSHMQIEEYLTNCHNINFSEVDLTDDILKFYHTINEDWMDKLKNN